MSELTLEQDSTGDESQKKILLYIAKYFFLDYIISFICTFTVYVDNQNL
jgi:hypothetical protein